MLGRSETAEKINNLQLEKNVCQGKEVQPPAKNREHGGMSERKVFSEAPGKE